MKNWKRLLCVAMTLVMLVGVLPTAAFAEGEGDPVPLTEPVITLTPKETVYTGSTIEIGVEVTGITGDYTLSCNKGGAVNQEKTKITVENAETYTVTATPSGGTAVTETFTIKKKPITELTITLGSEAQTYDGGQKTPSVTVTHGNTELTKDTHYTVEYGTNINAGENTGTVTITAKDGTNYTGSATKNFTIQPVSVATEAITATVENITYGETPAPVVTYRVNEANTVTLTKDTDYTVSYSGTDAGAQTATITFHGNYSGSKTVDFTINSKTLDETAIQTISPQTYTGSAITPVVVKDGDKALEAGTDYDVTYANNVNIAAADTENAPSATVSFKGNYTGGPFTKKFAINPIPTDSLSLTVAQPYAYNGQAPTMTVKNGETTLTTGFTLTYRIKDGEALTQAPVVPGTYTVTATFDDTYAKENGANCQRSADYTIGKGTITDSSVATAYDFCHASDTAVVTVTVGGRVLTADTDYTVVYTDANGTRTITVTGKGNYEGSGQKTQTILTEEAPTIEGVASNGTYHTKPTVKVTGTNAEKVLVKQGTSSTETEYTKAQAETGFELDFSESAYTIRAVDKAGKSYTLATNVTVTPKSITSGMVTITGLDDVTYDGTAKIATSIVVKDGTETLELGIDKDYTVSYTNNTNAGTATVTITGIGNYTGTVSKTFTIKAKPLTGDLITLEYSTVVYTGDAHTPTVTVCDGSTVLVKDTDYTLSYINNTNPGKAKVTVTLKGNYSGTLEKSFTITSDLTTLKSQITAATEGTLDFAKKLEVLARKAAYDALTDTEKTTVRAELGTTWTKFVNRVNQQMYTLKNLPSRGYFTYTKGTSSSVAIKIDADFSRTDVVEIRIGKYESVIPVANYTVTEGSVVVTLSSSYLKTIKTSGTYYVYIDLLDNSGYMETVAAKLYVRSASDIPQTGDPFRMTLWVSLLGASVLALAGLGVYEVVKKKKKAQKRLEAAMDLGNEPSDEASTNE